jgi:SAM-dependent methyltransferase
MMNPTRMIALLDEDHHWWFATRTRAILAFLDRYLGAGTGRRVLDIGCGAGNMSHHLRHYGQVVGLDNNARPLQVARQRGVEVYEGRADDLPFGDGEFDLVALLDTVEHVPDEDRVFDECRRVLRGAHQPAPAFTPVVDHHRSEPSAVAQDPRLGAGDRTPPSPGRRITPPAAHQAGKLLVTVPAFMFLWSNNDVINLHQRRYTAGQLRAKLESRGFKVLRISYNNFLVFPLAASLILLRRGRSEPALSSPHCSQDAYQVEMEPAPRALNALLDAIGRTEISLLRRMNLPVGTSIIAIAERS